MIPLLFSTFISFFAVFVTIHLAYKIQNPVRSFVPKTESQKSKVSPFGGIAMFFSAGVTCFIFLESFNAFVLLIPAFLMLLLGLFDDLKKVLSKSYKGISSKTKLFFQSIITVFVVFLGYTFNPDFSNFKFIIPFYGVVEFKLNFYLSLIIAYFAFTGTVNAVNLTDGLDGLAGKQIVVILAFLSTILYFAIFEDLKFPISDLKTIIFAFLGSVIGFLFWNLNPAKIFMGDAGSMGFGCLIASIFIVLKLELLIPFVCFVIFFEALSVILQVAYFKITKGKRIFKMSPIHHHFQLSGMKEQKITEVAFLISFLLALIFLTPFL